MHGLVNIAGADEVDVFGDLGQCRGFLASDRGCKEQGDKACGQRHRIAETICEMTQTLTKKYNGMDAITP